MKPKHLILWSLFALLTILSASDVLAQSDGYLAPVTGEDAGFPPGATRDGEYVLHPITSDQENLHLLAGFYFSNPREWKRIYQDNKSIIRNPNRLPVGQTLRIHVGASWKPRFSYQEWFQLANRNGQWNSGQSWTRARESSGTAVPAAAPVQAETAVKPPEPQPTSTPQPAQQQESSVEAEIAAQPQPTAPPQERPVSAQETSPAEETPSAETPPAQAEPQQAEGTEETEQAPAF